MAKTGKIVAVIILALAVSIPVFSEVYSSKGKKGNVTITNSQTPATNNDGIGGKPEVWQRVEAPATKGGQVKQARSNRDITVLLYMTDWCPYCRKAREYLNSLGVNLIEYNVERDPRRAEEFRQKGGNGVPLVDVEGIIMKGYSAEQIKAAVEKRKAS